MSIESYLLFNDATNDVFFDGRFFSRPVYLDLEQDARIEMSNLVSLDPNELDQELGLCVANTLRWDETNIFIWHFEQLKEWQKNSNSTKPPFSALLLTLSLAAEHMCRGDDYSANNYYQRLAEIYGIESDLQKSKLRTAGKYTIFFWQNLNQWLINNDHSYGRPTAKQVNSWKYVSYSISQSLVRDADRNKLHKMFSHFGLAPHENLSESEICLYLHEWMAGSEPSQWLKKLWSIPDLRDRVAAAAISELENWKGIQLDIIEINTSHKLTWAVTLQGFPKSRINLHLVAGVNENFQECALFTQPNSSFLAKLALENCNQLNLTLLQGTQFAFLEPINKLNINALMLASFELSDVKNTSIYKYESKAIIPLIKLEGSSIFREVLRLSLFKTHIILCHTNWQERIENYLNKFARKGFIIKEKHNIAGLPDDWILFQGIEIISVPSEEINDNLQSLVPLSEGVNIYFNGGLKLAPAIWHAKMPPDIFAADEHGMLEIDLKILNIDGADECNIQQNSKYNPKFLKSFDVLANKNIICTAKRNSKVLSEKDISFRTADTPRKLIPSVDKPLGYNCDEDHNLISGISATPLRKSSDDNAHLKGMIFTGDVPSIIDALNITRKEIIDVLDTEDEGLTDYIITHVEGVSVTCIVLGYHYWICSDDSRSMRCKNCGLFQMSKRKKTRNSATSSISLEKNANEYEVLELENNESASFDIVYDAICYSGAGDWQKFQSIVSTAIEVPWHVSIVSQNFSDLGLIDIMMKPNTVRPSYWSCSPPALVLNHSGTVFLAGYRSDQILGEIKDILDEVGEPLVMDNNEAPSSYLWNIPQKDTVFLKNLLSEIVDPLNRPLNVVNSPTNAIAIAMPSIISMVQDLTPIHIRNNEDIEQFDLTTGHWRRTKLNVSGAFRTSYAGRRYFYRDSTGNTTETGYQLAKLLAARDASVYLHSYNPTTCLFECVIGAEPPGLYRRALIACSGLLPKIKNNKLQYSNIPKEVGFFILHKLYH